jgi:hypothetical protein
MKDFFILGSDLTEAAVITALTYEAKEFLYNRVDVHARRIGAGYVVTGEKLRRMMAEIAERGLTVVRPVGSR